MTDDTTRDRAAERNPAAKGRTRSRLHPYALIFGGTTALSLGTAIECRSIAHLPSLLYGCLYWEWWGLIIAALWGLGVQGKFLSKATPKTVIIHAVLATALGITHLFLLGVLSPIEEAVHLERSLPGGITSLLTFNRLGMEVLLYICACGVVATVLAQVRSHRETLKSVELQRQLAAAQLQALQSQMEPHFLFNTLNAITSLMAQGRNQEAMKTLAHLNTILRTTLARKSPEKVPFAEELRVIESYLAIQKVRFAGRLEVKIDASDEALDGLIPCFLLQPIVENAVQHGIAPKAAGGFIETHVKRVGDTLWMQVRDNGRGPGNSATKGHGIGMQNTRERLAYFYPDAHEFRAMVPADGGYEVTIQIPYERALV
jgi:hypothetical protein